VRDHYRRSLQLGFLCNGVNSGSVAYIKVVKCFTTGSRLIGILDKALQNVRVLRFIFTCRGTYVPRLVRGDSVYNVSHWLASRRDRGRLQALKQESLRKYLRELAHEVERKKRENPASTPGEVKAAAASYMPPVDQMASPQSLPRRRGQAYQPIGSFICDQVKRQNKADWLWGLVGHYYEQLERLRMVEEEYHHDKKLPTQAIGNVVF
jgi:hypothetical protein